MEIRPLDIDDPSELRRWYDVSVAAMGFGRPDLEAKPYEERILEVTEPRAGMERLDLIALEGDELLGAVKVWLPTAANRHVAWVVVHVDPAHRRRGVGTALAEAAEQRLPDERRELLGPVRYLPGGDDHAHRRFGESVGYSVSTVTTVRELAWPVDPALLDVVDVDPHGYRIEAHVDGVPARHRASLGELKGLVAADSPSGDMEWEVAPVSPEAYADELSRAVTAGHHRVEALALTPDGQVVAYTEVEVPLSSTRPLAQLGTLVRRDHRGHRLGLAVKVANLRKLLGMDLAHRGVQTRNDDGNSHMVAINEVLGFVPVEVGLVLVKRR
jgi:GNAT superfamily N-acetyltransferase